ncbi:MAG TPA: hypothetical protein ENO00_06000 [Deltaproteobacteria bacterium]|nr:hypothetical protein [Deltaproteobacteria bacterium]
MRRKGWNALGMILLLVLCSCAVPEKPAVRRTVPDGDRIPRTLAILHFENNSITEPEKYHPLSKGLAAMLITDLIQNQNVLKIIERNKIEEILKEIALSQTGSVDNATALRAGRILGAQSIAFGSFVVLGKNVRIDTRIINVETSEMIMAENIIGLSDSFMQLEQELAKKIARALNATFRPAGKAPKGDIEAALYFSQGVEALDRGDTVTADKYFKKAIDRDPSYRDHINAIRKSKQ